MVQARREAAVVALFTTSRIDQEKATCLDHFGRTQEAVH
jgi:hypothetical protein